MNIGTQRLPIGSKFGLLTIIAFVPRAYRCRCDCGRVVTKKRDVLTNGKRTKSCGCLGINRTHGMRHTPEYRAFHHAKHRCRNPKDKSYPNYGGRGIEFRFESFEEFFAEVGPRPSTKHSIDRIDNDGHYEKGNVRWATQLEQVTNQRKRRPHKRGPYKKRK